MAKNPSKAPASSRQAKIQAAQKQGGGGANKIVVATVVVIVAIIAVVAGVIWMEQSKTNDITGGGNALPPGVSKLGAGYPAFQDVTPASNAPTVDLFEDFQCPACAAFEQALGSTFQDQAKAGKIKLVYHVKNFLDDNLRNDSSTRAGNAAFCAADDGKFETFHNVIYANQPANEGDGYTDAQLKSFAEQAGVTGPALETWQKCYDAGKYVDYVNSVEQQSFSDGVRGTPTVRIDGKDVELKSIQTPELLLQAIQNATK
jgi:protein-disulfide isomerase